MTVDLTQAAWRTSSRSTGQGGQCVEVATNLEAVVAVRDSKDRAGGTILVAPAAWAAFAAAVASDQL